MRKKSWQDDVIRVVCQGVDCEYYKITLVRTVYETENRFIQLFTVLIVRQLVCCGNM